MILAKAVASMLDRAKYWQRKLHIPIKYGFFEHLLANLRLIFRCLPPFAAFNSLRSVMNAWPTSARVAQSPAPCLFGCGGSAPLLHYCMCPPVLAVCAECLCPASFLVIPCFCSAFIFLMSRFPKRNRSFSPPASWPTRPSLPVPLLPTRVARPRSAPSS